MLPSIPEADRWRALALERLARQITYAVNDEGVHREHSPSYHAGLLADFSELRARLERWQLALEIDIDGVIASMFDYLTFATPPLGGALMLGDSSPRFGSTRLVGVTQQALYSMSRGREGRMPTEVDRVFPDAGYAFFRDAWHDVSSFDQTVFVAFVASVFSRAHKHCDDLSVLLYGLGEEWLVDSGAYSYNDADAFHPYSLLPRAHNVVEVDERSYFDAYPAEREPDQALHLLVDYRTVSAGTTSEASMVVVEHELNGRVRFRRRITFIRPRTLQVEDTLESVDGLLAHTYDLYWHLAADKVVTPLASSAFVVTIERPDGPYLTLRIEAEGTELSCDVIEGQLEPTQGWVFPRFFEAREAPVVHCRQRGRGAMFRTQMTLHPGPWNAD